MSNDTQSILCSACRVPLEDLSDGKSENIFACPSCGISDTRENVLAEVKSFVTELAQRSLQESMRKVARGNNMFQFKGKPIPKKSYRFVTDHQF